MRTCGACGAENVAPARFCGQCGAPLAAACERCGADLPVGVRFCLSCGAPVAEPVRLGEERKLVTVLFADVAGSTGLGERLDPERLKEVMGAYFEAMRAEIEAEGGTVEKFIGDAVMAVFGVPAAHEDDPTRALRAALRMGGRLARLNETLQADFGVTLAMRIGINTGEVVAATVPRPGEGMVTGDAVNVAARLEQSADSGQVLVAERTARAARGLRLREVGRLALKGKVEAVRAFELLLPEAAAIAEPGSPAGRRRAPATLEPADAVETEDILVAPRAAAHLAPMVGREREMDVLRTLYERVTSERRPQIVTIYGDAGVGKTRLVEEFEAQVANLPEPPRAVRGRCLPYGEGVTYWPLAEILKVHAGVLDSDPSEVALGKIRETAEKALSGDAPAPDPARAIAALAFTVGLEDRAGLVTGMDPRRARTEVYEAWRAYFSALASEAPAVVVVEDIHWADPAMLDLLQDLADRVEGPALFLCPSRPELTARHPGWGGGRWNFSAMLLDPLTPTDSNRLLALLLGDQELPAGVGTRILERAGGNPFFLEEIVRHLMDERQAVADEEGWLAASEVGEVEIPDTVQGVLAARMDLLAPGEKRVLRAAAVVGRVFWSGSVERLLPDQGGRIDETLGRLEERGLVMARLGSTMAGEREYVFRHILTRDVAYESLPRRERAASHAAAAAWIEEQAGERQRELAELLAHHYGEAHRGAREDARADPARVEDLRARAFAHAVVASEDARGKLVLDKAELYAETALSLAKGPLERSRAREALGFAYFHDAQGDLAWQCLKDAVDFRVEAGETGPGLAGLCASALEVATRGRGAMRHRLSRAEAAPYLETGLAHAGPGETVEKVRLLITKALWPWSFHEVAGSEGEQLEAKETAELAAGMATRLSRPDLASAALDAASAYYLKLGLYERVGDIVRKRLELVGPLADPLEVADIHSTGAWAALNLGRYREAFEHADEGFRCAQPASIVWAWQCLDWRLMARCRLGDWDGFFQDAELFQEMLGDRRERPPGYASDHVAAAAFLNEVQGDQGSAEGLLQLLAWLMRAEERPAPAWTLWPVRLYARRGELDEARAWLERGRTTTQWYPPDDFLEAELELIAEEGAWERASAAAGEARAHAAGTGLLALPMFAARLEGRAAMAGGDPDRAVALLEEAERGFAQLEAAWEAAVTGLDLAKALAAAGRKNAAQERLGTVVPVLDRLRSQRELLRAGELEALLASG